MNRSSNVRKCNAQLLSAYDQAYGHWYIQLSKHVLSRRRWCLPFPDYEESDTVREKRKGKDGDLQLLFPQNTQLVKCNATTKSVRSVSCILNLEKNGRFSLILSEDGRISDEKKLSSVNNSTSIKNEHSQPLQGEWFLTPNPYCVTDRHFDSLLLVSEPRMRMRHDHHPPTKIIERATVELRCKVWGRFGGGAVRNAIGLKHGRIRGRMSHGTILLVKEKEVVDGNKRKSVLITREIMGTFRGMALIDSESSNESDNLHGKYYAVCEDDDADHDEDDGELDEF